jgi:hypothetical protein
MKHAHYLSVIVICIAVTFVAVVGAPWVERSEAKRTILVKTDGETVAEITLVKGYRVGFFQGTLTVHDVDGTKWTSLTRTNDQNTGMTADWGEEHKTLIMVSGGELWIKGPVEPHEIAKTGPADRAKRPQSRVPTP